MTYDQIGFNLAPFIILLSIIGGSAAVVYLGAWAVKKRKDAAWLAAVADQEPDLTHKSILSVCDYNEESAHDEYKNMGYDELKDVVEGLEKDLVSCYHEVEDIKKILKTKAPKAVGPISPGYAPKLTAGEMSYQSWAQATNHIDRFMASEGPIKDLAVAALAEPTPSEAAKEALDAVNAPYETDEDDEAFLEEILKETFAKKAPVCQGSMHEPSPEDMDFEYPAPSLDQLKDEYANLADDELYVHIAAALMAAGLEDLILSNSKPKRKPAKKAAPKKAKKKTAKRK